VPEALAGLGFDWVLLDTEHSPQEVTDILPMLQAMTAETGTHAIVRPDWNDPVKVKRYLDFGAQTLLIPYVQTREEAEQAVAAMHYPPRGMRGVAGLSRASRYGRIAGYTPNASEELCLLLQVETAEALGRLEEIAGVEGVDGIFLGPSDISTSMGFPGQPTHPEVKAAIFDAIDRLKAMGKPAGILTLDEGFARECLARGTLFTAVGLDLSLLLRGATALRAAFR
jgi:4-hydroxy-2-oxoheptanedioate aldolase